MDTSALQSDLMNLAVQIVVMVALVVGTWALNTLRIYWAKGKEKLAAELDKLDNEAAEQLANLLVAAVEEQARTWGPKAGADKLAWVKQKAAEKGVPLTDENIAAAVRMLKSAGMEATE